MSSQPQETNTKDPRVGVGVMIIKRIGGIRPHVLMGRRRGAHSAGDLAFPGGHLEFGERAANAIARELAEECGVRVGPLRLLCVANVLAFVESDGRHYIEMTFIAEWESGEPQNLEPDKCEGWEWVPLDQAVPEPVSPFCRPALAAFHGGELFYEV